jgi:hypothetical protein
MGRNTVRIVYDGDARRLNRATDDARRRQEDFHRSLSKAAKVSAGVLGVMGLAALGAVNAASNLAEQQNKAAVVFRGSEKTMLAWAKTTTDSFGISQRAALEYAGTFGNMLVPMGLARDKAGEMSRAIVELAADMASFNNASPEEVLEALRAGLSGEAEPLRRFGVFLDAARVKEEALRLGLVKQGQELSAAAKAQATYSIILKDTGDAQGDFARTADSVANSQRQARAELEDTAAALGNNLLPVAAEAISAFSDLVGWTQANEEVAKALAVAVVALAGSIILLNTSLSIYNSTALTAIKATRGLRLAMALTPWGLAALAVAELVQYIASQGEEADRAADAQQLLTDAVRDYSNAISEGKKAREQYASDSRRVEAAEISVARAQAARRQLLKDDNATLLDRREADLRVADAQGELRAAQDAVTASGMRLRNQQLQQVGAHVKARHAIEAVAAEFRDWANGIGPGGRIDTALERNKAGISETTLAMHTGRRNAELYAAKLRVMAAALDDSQGSLRRTARLAATLAEAWGRVVSLPAAREFVARFRIYTTVEERRAEFLSGRASGGPVTAGLPYLVGEKGPEVYVPDGDGTIVPNHRLRSWGRGQPVELHFHSVVPYTAEQARLVGQMAIEAMRGQGHRPATGWSSGL